jgi:hypothetical protein
MDGLQKEGYHLKSFFTDVNKESNRRNEEEPLEDGSYLGFFVSGTMILRKIDEWRQGVAPSVVAGSPAQILGKSKAWSR